MSEIVIFDIHNIYFGYPKYIRISDIQNSFLDIWNNYFGYLKKMNKC